jgi:hypothetical protein
LQALFWLVFTILGLHIFGGVDLPPPDQFPNFNSFMNSLVSTFNILVSDSDACWSATQI